MPSTAKSFALISRQLAAMRQLTTLPTAALTTPREAVSAWSPAEHLDHLGKVTTAVLDALLSDTTTPAASSINIVGRVLLFVGRIPRGAGRSPSRLRGAVTSAEELQLAFDRIAELLARLEPHAVMRSRAPLIPHPRFGGLTPQQALRFVEVHNDHHLRIIDDIRAAS